MPAVLLVNPKFPHNVGASLRTCAILGVQQLIWTGDRVPPPDEWPDGARLPREERMKYGKRTSMTHWDDVPDWGRSVIPVCIEVDGTESLWDFEHHDDMVYIFGPEDGSVPKAVRAQCHRFVRIPTFIEGDHTPYNLSHAVQTVLALRLLKMTHRVEQVTPSWIDNAIKVLQTR